MARERYYRRLTRPRSGVGTYSSLWLGPDHLLVVTSSGFSESYQRFYFRDIQAFAVADSVRFAVYNAVAGSVLGFLGLIALINTLLGKGLSGFILVPAAPALIVLAWNLFLGRTCKVTLLSGVQSVALRPLSRFRRTRKVFARIVPLIEAAQTALVPPPLAEHPDETAAPAAATAPTLDPGPTPAVAGPPPPTA
jgi:hypothetical protein